MRVAVCTATIAVVLLSLADMAGAAEIRVLGVSPVEPAVRNLAAEFTKETGHHVVLTVTPPAAALEKIAANEVYDAVIMSEPAMDRLDKEGLVNPESRERLAGVGLGVAVRAGTAVPGVSTPETFKATLSSAGSIVYGDPTLPGHSGEKVERILKQAGLLDALKPKIRIIPGLAASQTMIANGEVDLGLYNASEIPEGGGVAFAGPVPAPLQITTVYEGALMSDGSVPEAARAFVRFLAGADAADQWRAARFDPLQ
jgi:molybdate transport system substrate-binding protein